MTFKQKVYFYYLQMIEERVNSIQKVLTDLKESAGNETKSTAGDKHEVGLAMLQIEQANTGSQLEDALNKRNALKMIDPDISSDFVINGSLIKTNNGYLFLSTALGKAEVDSEKIIALSPQSPLGQKLLGRKIGERVEINKTEYIIESIL
ncbi:MAG: GreA/GreB family elongation factor [Ginsengibacter sp.]